MTLNEPLIGVLHTFWMDKDMDATESPAAGRRKSDGSQMAMGSIPFWVRRTGFMIPDNLKSNASGSQYELAFVRSNTNLPRMGNAQIAKISDIVTKMQPNGMVSGGTVAEGLQDVRISIFRM